VQSVSDQYYSRLLAVAKANKGIRSIENIKANKIQAIMLDGSSQEFEWDEVINYNNFINKK